MNPFKLLCCALGGLVGSIVYQLGEKVGEVNYQRKFVNSLEQAIVATTKKDEETEEN